MGEMEDGGEGGEGAGCHAWYFLGLICALLHIHVGRRRMFAIKAVCNRQRKVYELQQTDVSRRVIMR